MYIIYQLIYINYKRYCIIIFSFSIKYIVITNENFLLLASANETEAQVGQKQNTVKSMQKKYKKLYISMYVPS